MPAHQRFMRTVSHYKPYIGYAAFFILLCLMTIGIYYASLSYGFRFDDNANIVKSLDAKVRTLFSTIFSSTRWVSLWLNSLYYSWSLFDPFVYRIGALVTHLANGLLLAFVLIYAFGRLPAAGFFKRYQYEIALLTAGLFLMHPVQTQTVCYVIQSQLEGMAMMSILGSILLFLLLAQKRSPPVRWILIALLIGCTFLAAGSKEIAVVLPALLLLVDWFFIAQGDWISLKKRLPLVGIISAIVMINYLYHLKPEFFMHLLVGDVMYTNNRGNTLTDFAYQPITAGSYFISEFSVILHYIAMFFWPAHLSADYDWKLVESFFSVSVMVPLLILMSIAGVILYRLYHHKTSTIAFAALWFFVALLPRASVIPSAELVADYKTYIPSLGIFIIMAAGMIWLTHHLLPTRRQSLVWIIYMIFLIPWALWAHRQTKVWSTNEAFWMHIIQEAPNKARAHNNYAVALIADNRFAEALPYIDKAIELDELYPEPWNNRAVILSHLKRYDEAIEALHRSIDINPRNSEAYNNLALFLIEQERYELAETLLKHAISLRPAYGKAWYHLGRMYQLQKKFEEAWTCFKTCCTEAECENEKPFVAWGTLSMLIKRYDSAIEAYTQAIRHKPNDAELIMQLAQAHLFNKNYSACEQLCKTVSEMMSSDVRYLFCCAECAVHAQDYMSALLLYKKLETASAQYPLFLLRIAYCMLKLNDYHQAALYVHTFLSRKPPLELERQAQEMMRMLREHDLRAIDKLEELIQDIL